MKTIFWITLGVVACLTVIPGLVKWHEEHASKPDIPITLSCGDGYRKLPVRGEVVVNVPSLSGCWTDVLVRNYASSAFWIEPESRITLEKTYFDGETKVIEDFNPTHEVADSKKITGVRFKNSGSAPVTVRIKLN